ncbi:acyl-CoA dehydrogenase family protein [Sneathiella sp.]|uniref:acyl-CoA dehydrogenase family protein n=1 Tax=Sneathiella sp. TaxID=1964365 RepID=UPI003564F499
MNELIKDEYTGISSLLVSERAVPGAGFPCNPEHVRLAAEIGTFADQHFKPIAAKWDTENTFPLVNFEKLKDQGWLGIPVSTRFGGQGLGLHENPLSWVLVIQQLSKACGNTGQTFQIWGHCMSMIEELSTPEQAKRFTQEAMQGIIWCSGGSEPSNYTQRRNSPTNARTTYARKVDGGVRVSGRKLFISNSTAAERFFIFAELMSPEGEHIGMVHPVINRGTEGLTVENTWDAMGMRGTASDNLILDDVFVPDEDIIGMHNPNGYYQSRLAGSFLVGRAAVYLGIADAAFLYLVQYLREKVKSGDDPIMQYRIGQLEIERQQSAAILYRAAWVWQEAIAGRGDMTECATYAALSHTAVSETALRITNEALELCGGRGMLKNSPLERYHRDVRAYSVSPPTSNATRVNIGTKILAPLTERDSLVGEGV